MKNNIEIIENKIFKTNARLTKLCYDLIEAKKNRIYECTNCSTKLIEKELILIQCMTYCKSYNSYDDPYYKHDNKIIVCANCHEWLAGDEIEYPKDIEKYCHNDSHMKVPDICKPFLERQEKAYQEERLAKNKKQDITNAIKVLQENGIIINE